MLARGKGHRRLVRKRVIVTRTATVIGCPISLRLACEGIRVTLANLIVAAAEKVYIEIAGNSHVARRTNATKSFDKEALIPLCGRQDTIVNNACLGDAAAEGIYGEITRRSRTYAGSTRRCTSSSPTVGICSWGLPGLKTASPRSCAGD